MLVRITPCPAILITELFSNIVHNPTVTPLVRVVQVVPSGLVRITPFAPIAINSSNDET